MTDIKNVATPILLERIAGALGVLDGHVHKAKLEANMRNWADLAKTLDLIGATFDNVDDVFGEIERRGRVKA